MLKQLKRNYLDRRANLYPEEASISMSSRHVPIPDQFMLLRIGFRLRCGLVDLDIIVNQTLRDQILG